VAVSGGSDGSADAAGDDGRRYRAVLRWRSGREATVRVAVDETVFAAADAGGVALPIGCRTGACGTCTGRVLSGELVHRRPPRALKDRHVEDGYVLLCIAEPRSDVEIEVGSRVARDLTSNPWK
jgi:ferredoxin